MGVWSVRARIAGAVVSSGMIQVESNRQVVEHPEGGVVGEILAKDGDVVAAGDVVLRLDNKFLLSSLKVVESQLFEIRARMARLEAERDGRDGLLISNELMQEAALNPEVQEMIDGQQRLFEARRESLQREADQIGEQILQANNQIEGTEAQLTAYVEQEVLVGEELANSQRLLDQGLIEASRVSTLQRERARLLGEIGNLTATVARLRGEVAALEIQDLKLTSLRREDAITTLRDLEPQEIELAERLLSGNETLSRMEVRSPVSGIVHGSRVFAEQSVISAAEPIMYVIPQDQPLIVSSRVESIHVDQVYVGQEVSLRFTAFDQRRTPEINGHVSRLSPDVFTDEVTGLSYYQAELLPADGELEKLGDQQLVPGMPVEAFIRTGDRSPLSYLTKPLADYFNKAFREG